MVYVFNHSYYMGNTVCLSIVSMSFDRVKKSRREIFIRSSSESDRDKILYFPTAHIE